MRSESGLLSPLLSEFRCYLLSIKYPNYDMAEEQKIYLLNFSDRFSEDNFIQINAVLWVYDHMLYTSAMPGSKWRLLCSK